MHVIIHAQIERIVSSMLISVIAYYIRKLLMWTDVDFFGGITRYAFPLMSDEEPETWSLTVGKDLQTDRACLHMHGRDLL